MRKEKTAKELIKEFEQLEKAHLEALLRVLSWTKGTAEKRQ